MDWDDPEARANLIQRVGVDEYNRLMKAYKKASTVATVNGRAIRPTGSRFGRLFLVEGSGQAFFSQEEAEDFARKL